MMFLLKICLVVFVLSSCIALPQINFHLTDFISSHEVEHDCLKIDMSPLNEKNTQETLSFCLTESMTKWNIQPNTIDHKSTFDQLRKQNVTSQQLYQWSASIDLIEQYQLFLNSNQSSLSHNVFYNCTQTRFGSQCQYEFIYLPQQNLTLKEIIFQFYEIKYEPKSVTCYIHLECDRGSKSICLDWSEICDGYVDCSNDQIDEKFCWKVLTNECGEDEYRCGDGQCISKQFGSDNSDTYDCLDRSDVIRSKYSTVRWEQYQPIISREDIACKEQNQQRLQDQRITSSCHPTRMRLLRKFILNAKSNMLSNICYFAFYCIFYLESLTLLICKDICNSKKCILIVYETCPDIIMTSSAPLAFGHVHVGYFKQTNIYSHKRQPDLICYDENRCQEFNSNNSTVTIYNNKTCRRIEDISMKFALRAKSLSTLDRYISTLHINLQQCNTISFDDGISCNSPFTYQCQNSSKCIFIHRLCDGIKNCIHGDDENCVLHDGTCSPIESSAFFKCPQNNKCIFSTQFGDDICDCPSYNFPHKICEDESYKSCDLNYMNQCTNYSINSYVTEFISFSTVCDGFQELSPILIDGSNYTDETECQLWQCNNTYTRCDGFWNCLDGADEVDCNEEYSSLNCPLYHHVCIEPKTFKLMCLPLEKANDGHVDCLGATDEPTKCRSNNYERNTLDFYCDSISNTRCSAFYSICTSKCINQDQDLFCTLSNKTNSVWSCLSDNHSNSSYLVKYFCSLSRNAMKTRLVYFSLKLKGTNKQLQLQATTSENNVMKKTFKYDFECHRGYPLRLWFNRNQSSTQIICFCPYSYYGHYCQYQNQRVSLTLKFQPYSDSRRTLFSIVIQLIDNSTQRIIHSTKQLTYIYVKHCHTKFNFYLIYSTRPKKSNQTYFIHIDFYEKFTFGYRGSLHIPLHFTFLPVHRVSFVLNIPRDNKSLTQDCTTGEPCINGRCMKYAENSNNATFCQCKQGWTGKHCSIPYDCSCSSDSLCAGIEANGRSICICPTNKWGPRCLLLNTICQSNSNFTCSNNGQCILIDDNLIFEQKFFCICPKGFSGDRCELEDSKIIVSFDLRDLTLPDKMLIHFVEVQENGPIRNGSTFQSISLYQNETTIRWSRPFHIVFAQISHNNFYLINVEKDYNRSKVIRKLITSSDRCRHMSEYVNETIINYPLIRRIKYYHLPCQKQISCFYDRDHFCLCNDFGSHRVANCFEFNPSLEHNCYKFSNCQHGGQCVQDDVHCPQTSRCICPACFYGSLCEFHSNFFDLSLDGIIGSHIQSKLSFYHQPAIIKTALAIITIMAVIGILNGTLSLFAFRTKITCQVGCGYYLLGSTITTLFTSTILFSKFLILYMTQTSMITSRIFLNIQCYSLDYLLLVCLNLDKWLNACVAMERAFNIIKGIHFNRNKSKYVAKRMIYLLVFIIVISTIYDPIHRQLVDDDSNDEQKRIWCIVSYSSRFAIWNQIIYMFHFFVPILLNIISALIIIILATKRRRIIRNDKSFSHTFSEQIQQHRHLLISPLILVLLSLPRLVISFLVVCMQSNRSPWIHLIGYLVSFIPSMLIFIIFVLPSKLYKEEFENSIICYQKIFENQISYFLCLNQHKN